MFLSLLATVSFITGGLTEVERIESVIAAHAPYGQFTDKELHWVATIIVEYGHDYCGFDPLEIIALAMTESDLYTEAQNGNTNGTNDQGLFQQNSTYWHSRIKAVKKELLPNEEVGWILFYLTNNRLDPISNTIVTIWELNDNRKRWRLSGNMIWLSHYWPVKAARGKWDPYLDRFHKKLRILKNS